MTATILKFEWVSLLRNRSSLLAIGLILLAGFYGIYYGKTEIDKQNQTLGKVVSAEKQAFENQKKDFKEPSFEFSWRARRTVTNSPTDLAKFSIGQRDIFPYYQAVRSYGLYSGIFSAEIANPLKLLTGNFDLSFVFIFLLPLLIIALCYNLLSSEREQGTLSILLSNQISLSKLVFVKLFFRFLLVLVITILLFLFGLIWAKIPFDSNAIAYFSITCLYILFWFGASFWIISLQKSSAFSALGLLGCWLLFVLIIPTMLNLYLESIYPVPNGANLQNQLRDISTKGWNAPHKETIGKYFAELPQNKVDTNKVNANMVFEIAAIHLMDKTSQPVFNEYKNELAKRVNASKSISWLSPAAQTQVMMNQLANTDTESHLSFLENMESYYPKLKGFFDAQKLQNHKFEKADFDKIPTVETPKIADFSVFGGFLTGLLFIGFFVILGILGFRKINLVS
jgi:ABC-2 type transport system permease protein